MFWLFVAAVVVAVIWRKTSLQREALATVRHAIDKGQTLDPAVLDKILRAEPRQEGGMLPGALAVMGAGVGLGVMGYFLKIGGNHDALYPLIGVGSLLGIIGVALLAGGWIEDIRARRPR
jgi:hypothetical protein